jgi:hypothetical protein
MNRFNPFLGNINHLSDTSPDKTGKKTYTHPAYKNLGSISIVLIREAIAPVIFRNAEAEITDIDVGEEPHIRAVPNKFKYPERSRGLQILRLFNAGGKMAQNKTLLQEKQKISDAFDLNTLVFGDSCNQGSRVLPVKAAVNYSDALSVLPKHFCVEESFHISTMEDGTLFNAEDKKNSDHLFTRHFVKPSTLMVQVLSTRGKLLPQIGLDHLLLCLGVAGSYGGQTSVTGTNIRTHIAGIYGGHFEQADTSPYQLVKKLGISDPDSSQANDPAALAAQIHDLLVKQHTENMTAAEATAYQDQLIQRFEQQGDAMAEEYRDAAGHIGTFFNEWFGK